MTDPNKRYAVFLDIDGVLTSARVQLGHTCEKHMLWDRFDPIAIDFLNRLDSKFNIEFVIASTWKNHIAANDPSYFHWIISSFRNAGFRGVFPYGRWKTNPRNEHYSGLNDRALEVKDYLAEFGPYDDFLIFDDSDYLYDKTLGKRRHVKCCSQNGILLKQMRHVLAITGNW